MALACFRYMLYGVVRILILRSWRSSLRDALGPRRGRKSCAGLMHADARFTARREYKMELRTLKDGQSARHNGYKLLLTSINSRLRPGVLGKSIAYLGPNSELRVPSPSAQPQSSIFRPRVPLLRHLRCYFFSFLPRLTTSVHASCRCAALASLHITKDSSIIPLGRHRPGPLFRSLQLPYLSIR